MCYCSPFYATRSGVDKLTSFEFDNEINDIVHYLSTIIINEQQSSSEIVVKRFNIYESTQLKTLHRVDLH